MRSYGQHLLSLEDDEAAGHQAAAVPAGARCRSYGQHLLGLQVDEATKSQKVK